MSIQVFDEQSNITINHKAVQKLALWTLDSLNIEFLEASIHFVETDKICELHGQYFDDPTPTDCISFPIDKEGTVQRVLGDVFVCTNVAITQAQEFKTTPLFEISLYVIHGLLHLIGYEDHTEEMKQIQDQLVDRAKSLSLLLSN